MKKFLITYLLVNLLLEVSFSQNSFAPLGAKWTYSEYNIDTPPWRFTPYTIEVVSIEDYQGKTCSKIFFPWSSGGPWIENYLYVYEEQDSVFYWSPYSTQFELLYNFSAQAGENWTVGGLSVPDPNIYDDHLSITVDSVTSNIINGETLLIQHHAWSEFFDWGTAVIQGVGSNHFIIPSFGLYEIRIGQLRCYEDDEHFYNFVGYPCDTVINDIVAVDDLNTKKSIISFLTNPVTDQLSIELTREAPGNMIIIITDLIGRTLQTIPITDEQVTIEMSRYPTGMYLLTLKQGGQILTTEKIVRQ